VNFFEKNFKLAQAVDDWRLVPRILVVLYGHLFYNVADWFMNIPDPTIAQTGFVSTIVGSAAAIFGLYVSSGKNNNK
jgi:hypothetical protein